ncbi:hypothetical protein ANRL2_04370 [Anaerolineae bacterium]|nr:hypothetical protein ANRL2_04370 [Anaerolineae bacterium]
MRYSTYLIFFQKNKYIQSWFLVEVQSLKLLFQMVFSISNN